MSDLKKRVDAAIKRITSGKVDIPVDATDPDVVLTDLWKEYDSLQSRFAAQAAEHQKIEEWRIKEIQRLTDEHQAVVGAVVESLAEMAGG